jgi:glycosyltransferase involved in cell wall biosynthesis
MEAKITYLVANYNNGRFIKDCIESLHAQTSPAWHCLIGDDGSTDDSIALIQPWLNEKIELVVNERNLGKSLTLARLIAQSPTDIVGILDPDDALYPAATAAVLTAYAQAPQVGFVYTNCAKYSLDLQTIIAPGSSAAIPAGQTTLTGIFVDAMRTFRISFYRRTVGYDERILYAEDRDLIYKMEEVTPFVFVDQVLYKYRQVPGSHTNSPEKRRIGIKNHRLAYCNALRRRKIRGIKKLFYLFYFNERYTDRRRTPSFLLAVAQRIKHFWLHDQTPGKRHRVEKMVQTIQ